MLGLSQPGWLIIYINRLDRKCHIEAVIKKGLNRLCFLRSWGPSVAENTICFAAIYWDSIIRAKDSKKLNNLIKQTGSVRGTTLETLELIIQRRMLHKATSIKTATAHPLHNTALKQRSAIRMRLLQLCLNTKRYRRSLLTTAITLHDDSLWWFKK